MNTSIVEKINEQISNLTNLGLREEIVPNNNFTFIQWSNGTESWFINRLSTNYYKERTKEKIAKLDANELVVPFNIEQVEQIIDQLINLPLYQNSFERKIR